MAGFDYERAAKVIKLPDNHEIHAMIAVGRQGDKKDLPEDLQQREQPSDRKQVNDFAFNGIWRQKKW